MNWAAARPRASGGWKTPQEAEGVGSAVRCLVGGVREESLTGFRRMGLDDGCFRQLSGQMDKLDKFFMFTAININE